MKVQVVKALTGAKEGKSLKDVAEAIGCTQDELKDTMALLVEHKVIFKSGSLYKLSPFKKSEG